ncbi:MAG TPA: hypothetical protein VGO91_07465 [Pyrinomonadaceae bacterium]|jgi:hypothetical protein|nr:hypothetical protein [Pyrinomonadaceae bacterium]
MDPGDKELYLVLAVMGALLIFAFVAVGIFIRVWKKERRMKKP